MPLVRLPIDLKTLLIILIGEKMDKISKNKLLGMIGLISMGAGARYVLILLGMQTFLSFALLMLLAFLAAIFYPKPYAMAIPLLAMGGSDLFLGSFNEFSSVAVFTYSGLVLVCLASSMRREKWKRVFSRLSPRSMGCGIGLGILLTVIYDGWTNLGWWILTPFYPRTLAGLMTCYEMALPFIAYHLLASILAFGVGLPIVSYGARCLLIRKIDHARITQEKSYLLKVV